MIQLRLVILFSLLSVLWVGSASGHETLCDFSADRDRFFGLRAEKLDYDSLTYSEKKCFMQFAIKFMREELRPKDTTECKDAWSDASRIQDRVVEDVDYLLACMTFLSFSSHSRDCMGTTKRIMRKMKDYVDAQSEIDEHCSD